MKFWEKSKKEKLWYKILKYFLIFFWGLVFASALFFSIIGGSFMEIGFTFSRFLLGLIGLALILGLYFLPTVVAHFRKKKNAGAIFILNFFLGWTFIGWVVALIWAAMDD